MVENVQCPVCTLFLHAGMNLSDHLETHPKEQVIKALVQMTISGGGGLTAGALVASLTEDKLQKIEIKPTPEKEHDMSSNSASNSSSSLGSTTCSSNVSLNFATNLSTTLKPITQGDGAVSAAIIKEDGGTSDGKNVVKQQPTRSSLSYQRNGTNATKSVGGDSKERETLPTEFNAFAATQQQHSAACQLHQQPTSTSQEMVGATHQHRATLPPPPPPLPAQQIAQMTTAFQSLQPQHALFTTTPRHPYMHPHQLQQQQNNLKIIYSSALPPPPPLQLFTYQPPPQTQHQKPPPAYGTAISQIRSQHNQNQQHHMRAVPPPPVGTSTSKHVFQSKHNELAPPPPPATEETSNHPKLLYDLVSPQHFVNNTSAASTANHKSLNDSQRTSIATTPVSPVASLSSKQTHLISSGGSSSSTASTNHQTNSPFASLLASPSPSSVLRYAESPVAHYLERENGDFIVQETPKHIVECVEKDNGEFSVIERIYQSPPSVLHIHDDDDDDDDDADDDDCEQMEEDEEEEDDTNKVEHSENDAEMNEGETNKDSDKGDEEEFISIASNSNQEDATKSKGETSGNDQMFEDQSNCNNLNAKSAVVTAAFNSNSNFKSNLNSNLAGSIRKKSSKNTITVLSDVQLNLNEYLDLVGNIIASSKVNGRRTFSGTTPIPVKVEKEEPPDEYEMQEQEQEPEPEQEQEHEPEQEQEPLQDENESVETAVAAASSSTSVAAAEAAEAATITKPPTNANKNETEELVENNFSNNKTSLNENDENPTVAIQENGNERPLIDQNVAVACSSHVTSVIRMATTSQQQLQPQKSDEKMEYAVFASMNSETDTVESDVVNEDDFAKDLSRPQLKSEEHSASKPSVVEEVIPAKNIPPPPPLKKGPKKLVIKPKPIKTDTSSNRRDSEVAENASKDQPSTSAMAKILRNEEEQHQRHEAVAIPVQNIVIKSEPIPSMYESGSSILEQHLKLGAQHHIDWKEEKPYVHENLMSQQHQEEFIALSAAQEHLKVETNSIENVVDDARVLLEFANSKKHTVATPNIFSSSSIFANATLSAAATAATSATGYGACNSSLSTALHCEDEFIAADNNEAVQEIVISSSYSSQSASDLTINNVTKSKSAASTVTAAGKLDNSNQPQQQTQAFTDYPFSFLYNGSNVAQQVDIKGSFSPIYHHNHDTTTAATLASGSNSAIIEDSSSTNATHQQSNRFGAGGHNVASHWYNHVPSTENADFEAALAVDCSAAVDGDVSKYLDLDSCKREHIVGVQAAPSSTSSSFAAATESSLAGGCTTDALNIRTDEKMPAKGEISEQESNCDIENSWSQPMYGDISARFFKTSFPGIFPHDNGWNHEEYFTVQDLSASTTAIAAANKNNRPLKSFDFRLPLEASTSATVTGNNHNNNGLQIFPHHNDALPSTSTNKKKRKRDSPHGSKAAHTRVQPTATITSQQLFLHQQLQQHYSQQHHLQLQQQNPTTSAVLLAGPSTAAVENGAAVPAIQQPKPRKKIYQCSHCMAEFPKLKERNSHMIATHNYVRQNRRLVCVAMAASSTATITTADLVAQDAVISSANNLSHMQGTELIEDSKHGIVKIEIDNSEQAPSTTEITEHLETKSEIIEEKENITALVPADSASVAVAPNEVDKKPSLQALVRTTPATKLSTLYRMLVSYNISTLKQSQHITEKEEKLIESSIFFCYICRRNFTSVKLYDAHLTEHPAECFSCGKKFHRWKNFSLHLKRHLGWKEFGCNVCDKKFVVRSALVEHMRMHTGHTPLKCKICGKYFKRYSNLTQHRKRHTKQIVRRKEYVCYCGEVLPSKARFLWHKETHDAKPKCCPHCCDRFVHANSLRRHIRLAHSDKFNYNEPMECPMCKQIFAKSSIKAHMATHSMDTQHDCPICNKSFSTKWNLKIHSWVHANRTTKPFKCEHCPKAFVREVDFKNHMNAHKQIKPYTCEYCGCKFIRKYNYMRHRREHHGNKKFTCDLCKKTFHRHYYLIEHRRIHTGERPFQCTICGKSSTTKTNHNKHLKIHHSRDPFTVEA